MFLSAEPKSGNRVQSETALARARIAVVKATAQATNTAIQYPQAELVELADNQAVLDALVSGEADAGVFSMINQEDVEKITQAMEQGTVVSSSYEVEIHDGYGFGLVLMKGNTELCRYLNRSSTICAGAAGSITASRQRSLSRWSGASSRTATCCIKTYGSPRRTARPLLSTTWTRTPGTMNMWTTRSKTT